ncbi:MAG: hypothetical protein D6693_08765 [Planctomycetota bacterium]|nr:MAG: hypothetical protein D6693_08765 [Planctomycetota bacterium]
MTERAAIDRPPRIPPAVLWPGIVIGLLAMSVIAMTITAALAVSDPSFAIVPGYGAGAEAENAAVRARRASAALGWDARVALSMTAPGRAEARVTLTDAAGDPIDDAGVRAVLYHPARSGDRQTVALTPIGAGVYAGAFRAPRTGLWACEVTAARDGAEFLADERAWLVAPR